MKYLKLIIVLLLSVSINGYAQNSEECSCCSTEYRQFDFWIGEWEVYNPEGKKVGENIIAKLQDGCVIQENWYGRSGVTGTSYNFYDRTDSTWNQIYIDNKGLVLKLKGGFDNNQMVLRSGLVKGKDPYYYNKITWYQDRAGNVIQRWEFLDETDSLIRVAFEGLYKKKPIVGE